MNIRKRQTSGPAPKSLDYRYIRLSEPEKSQVVERLRNMLSPIEGIVFAYLHGGFIERSLFRDIDVAVWIKDPNDAFKYTVDLSAKLEISLGLPVDLHVLNEAPLPFKYRVFTKGRLLLSKDERLRARIINETVRKYLDFTELLKQQKSPGKAHQTDPTAQAIRKLSTPRGHGS